MNETGLPVKAAKTTIGEELRLRALENPAGIACDFDGLSYSWQDMDFMSDSLGSSLQSKGVAQGDFVGLWGLNTIAWLLHFYALQKIGAVACLINSSYKSVELQYVLRFSGIRCLLVGEIKADIDKWEFLKSIRPDLPALKECIDMEAAFRNLPAGARNGSVSTKVPVSAGDTACMMFTSGTTSHPKGVLLSHESLIGDARLITRRLQWTKEDRQLVCMPLFHCSGLTAGVLLGLCAGVQSVLLRLFQSVPVMEAIQKYHCTAFNAVPSMLFFLMNHKDRDKYDLSSIKTSVVAGSGLSPQKYRQIQEAFGWPQILPAYGQTETAPLVTMASFDDTSDKKAATIGKAFPGIAIRVADQNTGLPMPVNETGEIQVKGFCVMKGYYHQEDITHGKFTEDGWLKTGDAGFLDEEGYLHFQERLGDFIIRCGENIAPKEIEQCVESFSPSITAVKVIGVEAELLQEEVVVFIVAEKKNVDTEAVKDFVRTRLADYKLPKYIFQLSAMPMTASGKPDQSRLKRMAKEYMEKHRESI